MKTNMSREQALEIAKELLKSGSIEEHDNHGEVESYSIENEEKKITWMDHPGILLIQIEDEESYYNFDAHACTTEEKEVVEEMRGLIQKLEEKSFLEYLRKKAREHDES